MTEKDAEEGAARAFEGGFRVGALGEIAIRCRDLAAMEAFYRDVIGLELLARRAGGIVFFRIAQGFAGHTAVLALFAAGGPVKTGAGASLHHLALSLTPADQERAVAWYRRIGQAHRIEEFPWIGWRGVFTTDPEGNTVELVAATGAARGKGAR
jgi:catechol 2,3-dioxygenase-like lactoylglutathione lyase family enzyme